MDPGVKNRLCRAMSDAALHDQSETDAADEKRLRSTRPPDSYDCGTDARGWRAFFKAAGVRCRCRRIWVP